MSDFPRIVPRSTCDSVNATCPISQSFYGYAPSLGPNVALLVIFALTLIAHGVQGIYYRAWGTLTAMGWGCICEVLGYAGRLMMHPNAFNLNGYANSQNEKRRLFWTSKLTMSQIPHSDLLSHYRSCFLLRSNISLLIKTVRIIFRHLAYGEVLNSIITVFCSLGLKSLDCRRNTTRIFS